MSKRETKVSKIRIEDISISYIIRKSKVANPTKTVIFLHGFPFNKNTWRDQLNNLDESLTGIAIDIRGHGHTTSGHGFFSIDVFAKDLIAFIKKLGLENVVLCGVSMGGYIALRTFEILKSELKGLILSDTHSFADDNKGKQKRFDSIQAVLKYGKRPFSIGFAENIFSKKSLEIKQDAVELIKSIIRRSSIESICATHLALASRTDTTSLLSSINIPTLVIKGKEDKLVTQEQLDALLNHIPNVQYQEFEYSGHLPNLEESEKFNIVMNEFLTKI